MKTRIPKAAEPRLSAGEWILGIADAGKIEPVGRADRAAGRTVAGLERGFDVLRRPSPRADPFERADKAADLIVQERPCPHVKPYLLPIWSREFFDAQFIQCPHWTVSLTNRRSESREIVPSQETIGSLLHRG